MYNIPGTPEEHAMWSFAHAAHHLDIINVIYVTRQIALSQFVLDPFNPEDESAMENWSYQHQTMHQEMDQVLGISGFDLTDINWQDKAQRAAWISLNAAEHLQASNLLEIG